MELPPEVGELTYLEVLDLEGTEIINLPATVGKLTNLRCLKLSFYGHDYNSRKNHQLNRVIPRNGIANLLQLEELSIDVNPDDEQWNMTAKDIVKEICSLNHLEALKIYLPEAVLLNDLISTGLNMSVLHYRFTIGSHMKRIISQLPLEAVVKFEEEERSFKYVNGKGVPTEVKELLHHTTALFLDRHLTVISLSEFRIGNMNNLKFYVLGECDEIGTMVDANNEGLVLESLEYLSLCYMKNLRGIWRAPLGWNSLSHLKVLALYSCPQVTTILTWHVLQNIYYLEELVEVTALRNLISLQFYFPIVDSLKLFATRSLAWKKSSPRPFTFHFSVGLHDPTFSQVPECFDVPSYNHLTLANANGVDLVFSELLMQTHTFALINHHGVSSLSDFGIENLDTLLACSVEGCEEIETIISGGGITKGALQCLEHLCIYNLMELKSIWQGTVVVGSLHQLRILTLTKCPKLKIFSSGMIDKLHYLQHLTVQECHEIEEIIMESENHGLKPSSLPRLKSLVLLDLPQLRCIWVDDSLEWPSLQSIKIFKCNKLNHLPFRHANATRLKSIEGEESWWETLIWQDDPIKKRVQSLCILS